MEETVFKKMVKVKKDPIKAAEAKLEGNKYYGAGDHEKAVECYTRAILLAPTSIDLEEDSDYDEEEGFSHDVVEGEETDDGEEEEDNFVDADDGSGAGGKVQEDDSDANACEDAPLPTDAGKSDGDSANSVHKDDAGCSSSSSCTNTHGTKEEVPIPDDATASTYYSNRAAAYIMLKKYENAVEDCSKSLRLKPDNPKILNRRARAYESMDKVQEAYEDMKAYVALVPNDPEAFHSLKRLEAESNKRLEQQKEEMMGKLKDLGNGILGKFGLSLDNFKATQDPNTGGYSINFGK